MKKIGLALAMAALVIGTASAQFKVGFLADIVPDLFAVTVYTGEAANSDNGNIGFYANRAKSDFFQRSDASDDNELEVNFKFTGEGYEGYVAVDLDNLVNQAAGFFANGNQTAGSTTGWRGLGEALFDDFYVKGTIGRFTGYVGNMHDRGAMDPFRFEKFSDFVKPNVNYYGVILPDLTVVRGTGMRIADPSRGTTEQGPAASSLGGLFGSSKAINANAYDANDLRNFGTTRFQQSIKSETGGTSYDDKGRYEENRKAYMAIKANFEPITITMAGNLSDATDYWGGRTGANQGQNRLGAALRVSGDKIANLITFDVLYKVSGLDPTYWDDARHVSDGTGQYEHTVGVYAGLSLLETLGIGIGYTLYIPTQELDESGYVTAAGATVEGINKYNGPVFHGIDLRFNFNGVERLDVTFNNQATFSVINPDRSNRVYNDSFLYPVPRLGESALGAGDQPGANPTDEYGESWFAMYNGLGVKFALTDALAIGAEVGNRIAVFTAYTENDRMSVTTNDLGFAAYVSYVAGNYVTLEGGLAADVISNQLVHPADTFDWGSFTFSVPLRLKVAF